MGKAEICPWGCTSFQKEDSPYPGSFFDHFLRGRPVGKFQQLGQWLVIRAIQNERRERRLLDGRKSVRPLFPTLVDAPQHYLNGTQPDLPWIHA